LFIIIGFVLRSDRAACVMQSKKLGIQGHAETMAGQKEQTTRKGAVQQCAPPGGGRAAPVSSSARLLSLWAGKSRRMVAVDCGDCGLSGQGTASRRKAAQLSYL